MCSIRRGLAAALLGASVLLPAAAARAEGQNKIVYDTFDWSIYRSTHFAIYFYDREEVSLQKVASYAESGHVHWRLGLIAAVGALAGGYLGARQASERAARIVRPTLVVVVALLVLRIVTGEIGEGGNASDHFYRTARLIAALLIATLIPFLIDLQARRSSRVGR